MANEEQQHETELEERQVTDDELRQLDEWFRFAESIGQERLYNFLMAASILFLACATTITTGGIGTIFAIAVAGLGTFFSFLWWVLGKRQSKFHNKIDTELRIRFERHPTPEQFAIYHIHDMKTRLEIDKSQELNKLEHFVSNRRVLRWVPILFGCAFIIAIILGMFAVLSPRQSEMPLERISSNRAVPGHEATGTTRGGIPLSFIFCPMDAECRYSHTKPHGAFL